jgi:ribosomal protein L37AE/L43A
MATIRKQGGWIGSCPDCGNTDIYKWEGVYACDKCATAFEKDEIVWVKESEENTDV